MGTTTLALAGDTLVGAADTAALEHHPPESFFAAEVVAAFRRADLRIVNLECCISERGQRWGTPGKPFFFRAPPGAVEILKHLGVQCVNLANNHSLDYGPEALLDTCEHLAAAGIQWVGAGPSLDRARAPVVLETSSGFRVAVLGCTDHPPDYAATPERAGVAFADLPNGVPEWLIGTVQEAARTADAVLLTPHWGPNYRGEPLKHVRSAAATLGWHATLVAGHSAHVFQGVERNVLFDLGDFLQTYPGERSSGSFAARALRRGKNELARISADVWRSIRPAPTRAEGKPAQPLPRRLLQRAKRLVLEFRASRLRDDLSLLFLVTLDAGGLRRLEALPLKLHHCHTELAKGAEAEWIGRRFSRVCRALGSNVSVESERLVVRWVPDR